MNREEYERLRQELQNQLSEIQRKFPHYHHEIAKGWLTLDVYRVLVAFEVTDPCMQHAIKKLLVAGGRGAKNDVKDVAEAIHTLTRWQQMKEEDKLTMWEAPPAQAPAFAPVPTVLPGMLGSPYPGSSSPPPLQTMPEECLVKSLTERSADGNVQWQTPALAPVDDCNCENCCAARVRKANKVTGMSSNSRLDNRAS